MAQRPSNFPAFNTNGTDTRTPSAAETTDGFASAAVPDRQLFNGLFSLLGQWVPWFDQSGLRTSDAFQDHQLPGIASDAIGSGDGLVQVAGHFTTGAVYVDGYRLPPTDAPAHAYAADTDTYWDVDANGTLTPTAVANEASEPAGPANTVRVFRVITGATTVTSAGRYPTQDFLRASTSVQRPSGGDASEEESDTDRGILAVAGDYIVNRAASAVETVAGLRGSRAIVHGSSGAYTGHTGQFWGFAVNCTYPARSLLSNTVFRGVAGRASYLVLFGEDGLTILRRGGDAAASWPNEVSGSGWSLIGRVAESITASVVEQASGLIRIGQGSSAFHSMHCYGINTATLRDGSPSNAPPTSLAAGASATLDVYLNVAPGDIGLTIATALPAFARFSGLSPSSPALVFNSWSVQSASGFVRLTALVTNPTASAIVIPTSLTNLTAFFMTDLAVQSATAVTS
ncbi:MAG: hypothetical protein AAFN74_05240 [Myxococcota bacterium]